MSQFSSEISVEMEPSTKPIETPSPQQSSPDNAHLHHSSSYDRRCGRMGNHSGLLDNTEGDDPLMENNVVEDNKGGALSWSNGLRVSLFILILSSLFCTFVNEELRKKVVLDLLLWKWEVLLLVLCFGNLVCKLFIWLVISYVEKILLSRKKVLYFVYGIRSSLQKFMWLVLILIVWHFLLIVEMESEIGSKVVAQMYKYLLCVVVATLMWFIKTLLVKWLAVNFHVSVYFERIQTQTFNKYIVKKLCEPVGFEIRNEKQAEVAAANIYRNVASTNSNSIQLEDLKRHLKEDEAHKTMSMFEGVDGISEHTLKNWVVNVIRERRALALSLDDTKTAVKRLHYLVNLIVSVAVVGVWLIMTGAPVFQFLAFLSSQVLLMTFIFGSSLKTMFEGIVFLFSIHPFDVGDYCEIDDVQMVVEEMNLLTTVFLRFDNQKIIYPNSVLAGKKINNYYRSPDMKEIIDFCVHVSTPKEKLTLMRENITRYIENKPDHWYSSPEIIIKDLDEMNKIKFSLWVSHKMNFQDMKKRR